jgi:outer membrane lipoprotein-sorting protein
VAGRRDADVWTFRVIKPETVQTGIGTVDAIHLIRLAPPDSKEQTLDIWLAPSKEWYPVRIRFTDNDDEFVDQTLQNITRK